MNGDSAALLRLLEPAVRPGGLPGAPKSAHRPIEQRSFDSLLAEARDANTKGVHDEPTTSAETQTAERADPLRTLGYFAAIDNASLRGLVGREM